MTRAELRQLLVDLAPSSDMPTHPRWREALDELEHDPADSGVTIAVDVAQRLVELLSAVRSVPLEMRMPAGWMQSYVLPSQGTSNLMLEVHAPGDGASMFLRLRTPRGDPIWQHVLLYA